MPLMLIRDLDNGRQPLPGQIMNYIALLDACILDAFDRFGAFQ